MLVYAESPSAPDSGAILDRLLTRLGCSSRMLLAHPLNPALGGTTSLAGAPVAPADVGTVRLVRREAPSARSIFEDTPITSPEVWQPLQMRRVTLQLDRLLDPGLRRLQPRWNGVRIERNASKWHDSALRKNPAYRRFTHPCG